MKPFPYTLNLSNLSNLYTAHPVRHYTVGRAMLEGYTDSAERGGEEFSEHFGAVAADEAISVTIEEGSPAHFRETLWPRPEGGDEAGGNFTIIGPESRSSEAGRMRAQIWHLRHLRVRWKARSPRTQSNSI